MNIYIYNYKNYYNRQAKRENTVEDYGEYLFLLQNTNFNPNDGIDTSHSFGTLVNPYNGDGNYCLIVDDNNEIVSRWFIIEAKRDRGGQWSLQLHRDVIVDYYDDIISAPCFIEKAILSPNDPLIFNDENFTVNQIKTSETLLKDKTNCAWIVGYYDAKPRGEQSNYYLKASYNESQAYDIAESNKIDAWKFYPFIDNENYFTISNQIYNAYVNTRVSGHITGQNKFSASINGVSKKLVSGTNDTKTTNAYFTSNGQSQLSPETIAGCIASQNVGNSYTTQINTYNRLFRTEQEAYGLSVGEEIIQPSDLLRYNNKIVRFNLDNGFEFYNVKIEEKVYNNQISKPAYNGQLFTFLKEAYNDATVSSIDSSTFTVEYQKTTYSIVLEKISTNGAKIEVPTTIYDTQDSPYNIFAIPCPLLGERIEIKNGGNNSIVIDSSISLKIASALSKEYTGGGVLYDLQLLPYCPVDELIQLDGSLDLNNNSKLYTYITSDNENVGVMLHASRSRFTLDIPLENPIVIKNPKMENMTDIYRLVSPNFNGQFEFSAAKNGGIERFNVDCFYKPYSPYIHINPDFSLLYGKDFDDARGLICGGDFSLPAINDKWETYQINNKNYQEMFDRQIQNLEVQHKYQRIGDIAGGIAGAGQGATSGAAMGSVLGPVGAAAGGVIGGLVSAIGGAADYAINEALRNEALDYKKDLFGFQLGNIQALPASIAKTSAFTNNNKIFPMIEFYTCTDREKRAIAEKIAYNSMIVMVIGKIQDYLGNYFEYEDIVSKNYIKAKLIRIENFSEDYHVINEIAKELNLGVYF